jgi:hypothetical protein
MRVPTSDEPPESMCWIWVAAKVATSASGSSVGVEVLDHYAFNPE